MQNFWKRNWENLVFAGVILIVALTVGLILNAKVPGFNHFWSGADSVIKLALLGIFTFVVCAAYVVMPFFAGWGTICLINYWDDLHPDTDVSVWLKAIAMIVFGAVQAIAYLLLLSLVVMIPPWCGIVYNSLFDLAALRETVFSQYGWLIYYFCAYLSSWWMWWMMN